MEDSERNNALYDVKLHSNTSTSYDAPECWVDSLCHFEFSSAASFFQTTRGGSRILTKGGVVGYITRAACRSVRAPQAQSCIGGSGGPPPGKFWNVDALRSDFSHILGDLGTSILNTFIFEKKKDLKKKNFFFEIFFFSKINVFRLMVPKSPRIWLKSLLRASTFQNFPGGGPPDPL